MGTLNKYISIVMTHPTMGSEEIAFGLTRSGACCGKAGKLFKEREEKQHETGL